MNLQPYYNFLSPIATVIAAGVGYISGRHNRSATLKTTEINAKSQEQINEDKRREVFFTTVYNGWEQLNRTVDDLRRENFGLGTRVYKLEEAETRLTSDLAAARAEAKTATSRAQLAEQKADEERALFGKQRRAWADWAKKVLDFIRESGKEIPADLEHPPLDY